MSKAHGNTLWSVSQRGIGSKQAIPSSPHTTASPSMVQELCRKRASASAMRGKRLVKRPVILYQAFAEAME
jgi:hypothetical protein